MTYLLDANVLIALTIEEHEHHERASAWAAAVDDFAVCPIVEGALVRFLLRLGESSATAGDVVRRIAELPSCEFWSDSISYADVDLQHVVAHRPVTDTYLLALGRTHSATLVTFDAALAGMAPTQTLVPPD